MRSRQRAQAGNAPAPPEEFVRELQSLKVLREGELRNLIKLFRVQWGLADRASADIVIAWLLENSRLHRLSIRSEVRGSLSRYIWGEVTALQIAATLAPNAYFSHATAASFHGLLTFNPETIYLNREQSAKPAPEGPINPDAIERAFSNRQRTSQDLYSWDAARVAVLSGKNSGRLAVVLHSLDSHGCINITSVERTLVDLTVRPDYAGGPAQVLEAFRRSRSRMSVDALLDILRRLAYRYPYHQAIGFYMQRAGYEQTVLAKVAALGIELDFYVGYGIPSREFDSEWRVHYPRGL